MISQFELVSPGGRIANRVIYDEYCRAVANPEVYAVGDVARWHNPAGAG